MGNGNGERSGKRDGETGRKGMVRGVGKWMVRGVEKG